MKNTLTVFAVIFALFSGTASANEGKQVDILVGIGSKHFEKRTDKRPWNEQNTGLAIQYSAPGTLLGKDVEYFGAIGQVKNSEFGQTIYAGGGVRKDLVRGEYGRLYVGGMVGVMTYPSVYNTNRGTGDVFPVALPMVGTCLGKKVCLDMTAIPKIQQGGSAAVFFSARFAVKHW